jgi:hypothetical protein
MDTYAYRWEFQLAAEFDKSVSIEEKHRRLMAAFARHERPWGLKGQSLPGTPSVGSSDLSAYLSLTRSLKAPVRKADVNYHRRDLPFDYVREDGFSLEFTKSKISPSQFKQLIHEVLPDYVQSFGAYKMSLGALGPYLDYVYFCDSSSRTDSIPVRERIIPCICPVNFWSDLICIEGFGRNAQGIAEILEADSILVSWIGDGIYVCFSDELIPNERALDYELKYRDLLAVV